jgi:hypothetical protein
MNQSASKNVSAHDMEIFESVLVKMRDNLEQFKESTSYTI